MGPGTAEALIVFVLAIVPGVIVLEFIELGRARLRERDTSGTLARYFLFSGAAWAVGTLVFDVAGRLSRLVHLDSHSSNRLVSGYLGLAEVLLISAVGVGLAFRIALWAARKFGYRLATRSHLDGSALTRLLGRAADSLTSPPHAWDALLVRLSSRNTAQIAEVRLRNGGRVYGVLAERGQADYEADGRGLLLDAELIEVAGSLVKVEESSGVFIAADAVSAVSFVALPDDSTPKPKVESADDD